MSSDNSEVARIYSDLSPGFSDGVGYRVFIHVDVDLAVESDWQPPDCCCLWLTDVIVRVDIDLISDGAGPGEAVQTNVKSFVATELARLEDDSQAHLARLLKAKGIEETPHCLSSAKSSCDLARQELQDYLAEGLASYISSHLHGSEFFLCQRAGPKAGPWIANARGLVHYREVPGGYDIWGMPDVVKGVKEYAETNLAFNWSSFLDNSLLRQPGEQPCCFLIWVHGYNTSESEGLQNLDVVRALYNNQDGCCQLVGFLWHGDPSTKLNFGQAIVAANISAGALVRLVNKIRTDFPKSPITIAAHSLGSRVALRAIKHLPKLSVDELVLFNAAVDYDSLEVGKEFGRVAESVRKTWVIYHRRDDALIASSLPLAPYGPYYWAQANVALGSRGPKYPGNYGGDIESIDMTVPWTYDQEPDETTHSALYVQRVSSWFFANRFRFMVSGNQAFCQR